MRRQSALRHPHRRKHRMPPEPGSRAASCLRRRERIRSPGLRGQEVRRGSRRTTAGSSDRPPRARILGGRSRLQLRRSRSSSTPSARSISSLTRLSVSLSSPEARRSSSTPSSNRARARASSRRPPSSSETISSRRERFDSNDTLNGISRVGYRNTKVESEQRSTAVSGEFTTFRLLPPARCAPLPTYNFCIPVTRARS
jgi:hypothetical protein